MDIILGLMISFLPYLAHNAGAEGLSITNNSLELSRQPNVSTSLESLLNQSTMETKGLGYYCVPVPLSTDPDGYRCEPCDNFEKGCPEASQLYNKNTTGK